MKFAILLTTLAIVLVGCTGKDNGITSQAPGSVIFSGASVSLDVGAEWQRIDINPGPPICSPTLIGPAGIVRAMLFATNFSDVEAAANGLKAAFEENSDAVKDSFRKEPFTTKGGLQGIHLSYASESKKEGNVTEMRSHNYIVMNRESRCVSISYLAPATNDSDSVHQMIRTSLKLQ